MICIDPGVKACGMASFFGSQLQWARYVPVDDLGNALVVDDHLIIEMPRVYPGSGQQKGDLNDLLNLAAVVGRCEALIGYPGAPTIQRVFPSEWKGQVPKGIMTARIMSRLTSMERKTIEGAGAKTHNIIDAVGIGLWKLGRL